MRLLSLLACIFTGLFLNCPNGWGQTAPLKYWVGFTSKTNPPAGFAPTPHNLSDPTSFLSERSLQRRVAQGIGISEDDLPVPPSYLEALEAVEGVVQVLVTSKWLNAATVQVTDSSFDPQILQDLPFVLDVRSATTFSVPREPEILTHDRMLDTSAYGAGWTPLAQLGGDALHEDGFLGSGKWIAVIDAGFEFVDVLPVFETARNEGRIHEGLDAMHSPTVYGHHRHGTYVLGTMAGNLEDSLIGTAPAATYWLYRSEDAYSEYVIEEDYWIYAAEHADSIGVDLINTSLGYSLFDASEMNHDQAELNGLTTHISRAMTMAADRGILCVTSAGNSGAAAWHNITAPADAHGILAVGAVDAAGNHAPFSGFGPSADGRIKPEVMALGVAAGFPAIDSTIQFGNGTSFASPILCGLAACLWEKHPEATAAEIRLAIIDSAHLSDNPNDSLGNGIPNFNAASAWLDAIGIEDLITIPRHATSFAVFPQPASHCVFVRVPLCSGNDVQWQLHDLQGQIVDRGLASLAETPDGFFTGQVVFQCKLSGTFVLSLSLERTTIKQSVSTQIVVINN